MAYTLLLKRASKDGNDPHPMPWRHLMLVLTRKLNETIIIDGGIKLTVVKIDGNKVRLAIDAPPDVQILREELYQAKQEFAAPVSGGYHISEAELNRPR